MLARRKRRQEEEEELLVPHGLIWQATDNAMSPQPETANPAAPKEGAQATTNAAPPSSARSVPESTTTKAKLGAISPPLPWPSPQIQEIARPVHRRFPAISPEAETPPSLSAPIQNADLIAVPERDTTGESVSRPRFLSRLRTQRDRVAQVFQLCRERASEALLSTKAAVGKLEARVENAYQLSKLRRQIRDVEKIAEERASAAQVDQLPPVEIQEVETQQSRAERAFALFASMRGGAERAIGYARLNCERALVTARDRMKTTGEAARTFRIKIKFQFPNLKFGLPNTTTVESWLARGEDVKLRLLRRDSRLWTSMGMAALSALLALLVISGVRGYAPDASPAKASRNVSATPVPQPAAIAATKPSPATTSRNSKPAAPFVKRASLSTPAGKVASPRVTRKKMRHREEDDYVAKDTYVYYGLNGKTTR